MSVYIWEILVVYHKCWPSFDSFTNLKVERILLQWLQENLFLKSNRIRSTNIETNFLFMKVKPYVKNFLDSWLENRLKSLQH